MEELSLKIENISKEYRLGQIGGATLKGELQSKWAKFRHKEDPNLKIGEKAHEKNERFLALDDVSFEIKKGERIGIIGHNGAGKSTLLKLICRVTAPSKGNIYMDGRITSMLEVGTGFHNELTGRENIYLNGAILGMSKEEIDKRYDEIVEFSEIGQFIDTPIKRYSSGMKVKLGFAVASHLDSEIMIMDEVLAVGDVNFQNKCINRMKEVAENEGRTILYVSHNMATIKSLCDRCVVLSHGKVVFDGPSDQAVEIYMTNKPLQDDVYYDVSNAARHRKCVLNNKVNSLKILDSENNFIEYGRVFPFELKWESKNADDPLFVKFLIRNIDDSSVGVALAGKLECKVGENSAIFNLDTHYLCPGTYNCDAVFYDEDQKTGAITRFDDRVTVMRFTIKHSVESIHLRHWYKEHGYAVLPCINKK